MPASTDTTDTATDKKFEESANGGCPIHFAAESKSVDLLEFLWENGAKMDTRAFKTNKTVLEMVLDMQDLKARKNSLECL